MKRSGRSTGRTPGRNPGDAGSTPARSNVKWLTEEPEWFRLLLTTWDVRKAKELLVTTYHDHPVQQLNLGDAIRWMGLIGTGRAAHPIDLTIPVILVTLYDGSVLPIDGWKRIKKALRKGLSTLPCVILNKLETKKVRVR